MSLFTNIFPQNSRINKNIYIGLCEVNIIDRTRSIFAYYQEIDFFIKRINEENNQI